MTVGAAGMKCFDPFKLDVANQCLWRGHTRMALMPKPFDVLTYLVQNAGRLITQDELLRAVWAGTHVQPDVLRKHIKEVRRVLGDVATKPLFIETLPKRGYRFIAAVHEDSGSLASAESKVTSALVGRRGVFAALDERLRQALVGERQLVFVTGEAGIGKSSVVQAFERSIDMTGTVRVASGQSVEGFGGKEPYYPLLEALGRLGRGPDGSPVVETLACCAPTWLIQLPSLLPSDRRAALSREAAGATTQRMVRELCEALEVITRTIPLVLVLEDLHWVDHSTLDAISAIARRREPARMLIVGTYRPVNVILSDSPFKDLRRDLCAHGLAHELALGPLAAPDIAAYLATSFSPNDFPSGLETVLYRHSGGNPLFMTATLDHLVQRRVLEWDGACWRMAQPLDVVELEVPETLRHLLELQLEQLTAIERHALMAASVAGERFSSWDVDAMLDGDGTDAGLLLDALASRGQILRTADGIARTNRSQTGTYEFKHALYRDALYRRLPAALRATYHRRAADSLDARCAAGQNDLAGEVAEHYEAAGVYDRAVTSTLTAAQNALRRYAHGEALALLTHAAALNQRTDDAAFTQRDVELLQRVGDVRYAHGEMPGAADAYEKAASAATDRRLWAAAAQALLRAARAAVFFDVQRALAACERAARVAVDGGLPGLEARARLVRLCWDLLHRGWSKERAGNAGAVFGHLVESAADLAPADHILYANVQVFRSEYSDACMRADAALRQLQVTDTVWEHLGAMAAKAGALSLLGRWGEAYDTLTAGLDLARRNDNGPWLDILSGLLGSLHIQACDFAGARAVVHGRLAASAGSGGSRAQMHLTIISGGAELGLGHVSEATQRFAAVRASMPGDLPIVHWYWRLQASLGLTEAALLSGDLATAMDEVSRLTDAVSALDETMIAALAWECRARVHLATNAPGEAETSIDRALGYLTRVEVPGAAWRIHATAAAVRRLTNPSDVEGHLECARAILSGLGASLEGHDRLRQSLIALPAIRALLEPS